MRKSMLLLAVATLVFVKTASAQYTGTEWEVRSYQSVFGKNVILKIDLTQTVNVFSQNEKGKLVPIVEKEMNSFLSGNTLFYCKGIDTVKKKRYLRFDIDGKSYYLFLNPKNENEYLKSLRDLSVYENLVSECNKNFIYIKKNVVQASRWSDIESSYIEYNNLNEVADTAYKIQWTGFDCSFPNQYTKAQGLLLGKNKNYEFAIPINKLDDNDFFTEEQITNIFIEKERLRKIEEEKKALQRRLDSINDTKYHAFILKKDVVGEELETGDTIFMFSFTEGWHGGEVKHIYDLSVLQNVQIPNGSNMLYTEYKSYILRANVEGYEYRKELARQRDSISVMGRLEKLMNYLEELKSYYDELDKKQIFLIGKEFAFGDYSDFGLELEFYNCFKKTIKYIKFETKSYNKFGDSQGDYFGKKVSGGTCVGPLESGESAKWRFDELYYDKNDMIEYVCVTKVIFTFLDNSTLTFTDINSHKTKDVYNKNK